MAGLLLEEVGEGEGGASELAVEPAAEVAAGDLGGEADVEAAEVARALPLAAEGVQRLGVAGRDDLAVVALLVIAAVARAPYLLDIPRFTDETAEVAIGLRIARGEAFPLINRDPYIGALWNYLLAAAFAISGPGLYTPRLPIAVFGTLTVIPAYLLGKSLAGHRAVAGVLAGLLLALSPAHIVVNSHIAWSNCLTLLLTTFGLWAAHRAVTGNRPRLLVVSGFALGLGLQTHPVAALLLPGSALGVAVARPRWLLGPWPALG